MKYNNNAVAGFECFWCGEMNYIGSVVQETCRCHHCGFRYEILQFDYPAYLLAGHFKVHYDTMKLRLKGFEPNSENPFNCRNHAVAGFECFWCGEANYIESAVQKFCKCHHCGFQYEIMRPRNASLRHYKARYAVMKLRLERACK